MFRFIALLISLFSFEIFANEYCNNQRKAFGSFSFYPNGKRIAIGSNYYYPNGQKIMSASKFYYPDGKLASNSEEAYYPGGERVEFGGSLYFPNGKRVSVGDDFFYPNGQKIKQATKYYYPGGNELKSEEKLVKIEGEKDKLLYSGDLNLETGKLENMTYTWVFNKNERVSFKIDLFNSKKIPNSFHFEFRSDIYLTEFDIEDLHKGEGVPQNVMANCYFSDNTPKSEVVK